MKVGRLNNSTLIQLCDVTKLQRFLRQRCQGCFWIVSHFRDALNMPPLRAQRPWRLKRDHHVPRSSKTGQRNTWRRGSSQVLWVYVGGLWPLRWKRGATTDSWCQGWASRTSFWDILFSRSGAEFCTVRRGSVTDGSKGRKDDRVTSSPDFKPTENLSILLKREIYNEGIQYTNCCFSESWSWLHRWKTLDCAWIEGGAILVTKHSSEPKWRIFFPLCVFFILSETQMSWKKLVLCLGRWIIIMSHVQLWEADLKL